MRSENVSTGQEDRSFIEKARRAQIIDCAIDVIAERGYAKASLAEIAKRAAVSKGVISYYFAGKSELIEQVVKTVLGTAAAEMGPRVFAEKSATRRLRAYIESNLEFIAAHQNQVRAISSIAMTARAADGGPVISFGTTAAPGIGELEKLLRYGQKNGEFREFSTRVMAVTLRNAIDSLGPQFCDDPNHDLKFYADELANLFERATRKTSAGDR